MLHIYLHNKILNLCKNFGIINCERQKLPNFCSELIHVSILLRKMSVLKPSDKVRGMKELDKTQFNKEVMVARIKFSNCKLSDVLPHLKKYLLKMEKLKPIDHRGEVVSVLLNPCLVDNWKDISEEHRTELSKLSITEANFEKDVLKLTYDNFSMDTILKSVLPTDQEGLSSFTQMGHIIHVNLREHLQEYKTLIGQVLLEKITGCRTVINKTNEIDNTYRNFNMEVLSGEHNTLTEVKENNCRFAFDFATVYWNSRLCTEHERIINKIKAGDVVFDVFAGVGPFSIPAARKKCFVYSNDLNPESYRWLSHNSKLNKINEEHLQTYNKDGRDFIAEDMKKILLQHINKQNIHIIMNLPASAIEYMNNLLHLYTRDEVGEVTRPPIVYIYCFAKGEDYISITKNLMLKNMGQDVTDKIVDIFRVRTVSSLKEMMRVTVKLDDELLLKKNSVKRKYDGV